jgi:uncharacterized RDD family membrane protein YckC
VTENAAPTPPPPRYPSIWRRLASLVYEALLTTAILLTAGALFYACVPGDLSGPTRHLFQVYLIAILAGYFTWCWCRGGQTLPMKTWKLYLTSGDGNTVPLMLALKRFTLATLTYGASLSGAIVLWKRPQLALGWLMLAPSICTVVWAWFDRDRQFLHDRLAGTQIIVYRRSASA